MAKEPMSRTDRDEALAAWADKPEPEAVVAEPAVTPPVVPVAAPVTPPAAGVAPDATIAAADAPAASTAVGGPSDWIVAKRGDEEFRIPADAMVEFKRRDATLTRSMDDFKRDGMMGTDYQLLKRQLAGEREAFQREREQEAVARARMEERERFVEEQSQALREAQLDPAKFEQWQGHQEQLRTNPTYRKAFEDSLAKRETDAENRVLRGRMEEDYVQRAASTVEGWVEALASKYPGIDVQSVQREYAAQVTLYEQQAGRMGTLGEGPLTPQALEQVFQRHQQTFQSAVAPVTAQMEALKAEMAALKAATDAAAANAQTTHAVKRNAAPPTAPVRGGGTVAEPPKGRRESPMDREERLQRWVNG